MRTVQEINIDEEAAAALPVLQRWKVPAAEIDRIVEGWKIRAGEWNAKYATVGNTPDEIENYFIDKYRYEPDKLVAAIMGNQIAGDRVRGEILEEYDENLPLFQDQTMRRLLAKKGHASRAAKFFQRLAEKLEKNGLYSARWARVHSHSDRAVREWLHRFLPLPEVPPNCLLDDASLAVVMEVSYRKKTGALRTAISNWKLPRPAVAHRLPLAPAIVEIARFFKGGVTA